MRESLSSDAAANALLVCGDAEDCKLIVDSLTSLAIQPQVCEERFRATSLLGSLKFEAVIVDARLGEAASYIMNKFRQSPANHRAISFVITGDDHGDAKTSSTFVLQRPLSAASITRTLRAAYGLMVRERRRYFRCPVTVPALIRIKGNPEEVPCDTVNISEGGVSIHSPVLLESSVPQAMRLRLPGRSSQLATETSVRWRSPDGLVGLEFLNLPASQKSELQEWLAQKLEETLPESVAALFRSIAPSI